MTTTTLASDAVRDGLRETEQLMAQTLERFPGTLASACRRVASAGGKRLRARLVLQVAATMSDDHDRSAAFRCAAAVELLHCATLVHDDLVDAAPTRRGVATINFCEGPTLSLLAGDMLIGAASTLATQVSQRAGLVLAETLQALCAGQALEEALRYDPSVSHSDALAVAEGKTGSLMGAACLLGAEAGGAAMPVQLACAEFGVAFGMSLQLLDDLLDLVSTETLFGKPVAADFVAGRVTMPAVTALAEQPRLRAFLRRDLSDADHRRALALLRRASGVPSTLDQARAYASAAHVRIVRLPRVAADPAPLAAMPGAFCEQQLDRHVAPTYRHLLARAPAGRNSAML